MSNCDVCTDPGLTGCAILHAEPRILESFVRAINDGDVRDWHGEGKITVQLVSTDRDGHFNLLFTTHWPEEKNERP